MPKKKTPARKKAVAKKAGKKTTTIAKAAKRKRKAPKKPVPNKKPAPAKRKRVPKGMIPLTLALGDQKFHGYLKPLPQIAAWGGPEAFDIIIDNQPGKATISSATGAWVIQNEVQLPQQMIADIILTIQVYYNGKGFNTPM